ncbi:MAG: leucyl aminopeptidase [Bacteroidetes bacterium]|nr:MAG: leucyl aminopeptidase [Bacteroidota bacterium]REK03556.1 MAG: leucyl aminopeptidase [Bacteroidota bacterium]REK34618.1 MAG: leucyl aminopeptidase [Bacteroidota bacterium]REK50684.1 MAG: leucyl aminopeptidase [Bacteroidota bacterium]
MHITIRQVSSFTAKDTIILLLGDNEKVPSGILKSNDEKAFLESELKAGRKSVFINQYKRQLYFFKPDYKLEEYKLLESCRKGGDTILSSVNRYKNKKVIILDQSGVKNLAISFAEGMALGNYQFLRYFTKDKKKNLNSLQEIGIKSSFVKSADASQLEHTISAVFRARDLVNEPQSWLNATRLASEFVKLGKEARFKVEVMRKSRIKALKMGGLLAVNMGSKQPPTFTVMTYKPRNAKNKKPIVLVGKGVVYDTGGLSLKPTGNSMDYMKSDMAGAAVVGATMYAIAKMKLPVYVIALVPATDNRPAEDAYTPGDVIEMMSGNTVEVLNTDAEGRMILADALHFAKKYKPELVMDFATLTGAAAAAVGPFGIVCMGTAEEKTKDKLKESGTKVYERLAEFPFWDEYDELIKSDIADMKNIGGPIAGAITAGKFLQRFTDYPWMHFDIAGPSFLHQPMNYRGKNASGTGVRFLVDYLRNLE